MRGRRAAAIVLIMALATTGCALISSRGATALPPKQCAETPRHTVAKFLEGFLEAVVTWSTAPIRVLIAEGRSVLGAFGGGDEEKGKEVARQLYRHPEVLGYDSAAGIKRLDPVEMEDLGNGETRVFLEREDVVTTSTGKSGPDEPEKITETSKVFRRNFAVRFQEGTNCITAVRPIDPEWKRVQ